MRSGSRANCQGFVMTDQHTPGPWEKIGAGITAKSDYAILSSGRKVNFRVACCKDGDLATVNANARLIAAAPDMLAALKRARGELIYMAEKMPYTNVKEALRLVREAIAKAEGKQ
jgi:hypothetical protein